MEVKPFRKIYRNMINFVVSHQNKITDFNDGSGIASLIEAFARELGSCIGDAASGFLPSCVPSHIRFLASR